MVMFDAYDSVSYVYNSQTYMNEFITVRMYV